MPNKTQAFANIRTACQALEDARAALSAALLEHAKDEGKRGSDYAELQDMHRRVSQAAALLPHSGEKR